MKFHLIQPGTIGRRHEIEKGMAGQNGELYDRFLSEIKGYVKLADELGYASYGHNEHHMQLEGFEITNHPGMFSLFIGTHCERMKVATMGYVLPTHNPVRAAEEIATLDHMLQGRLIVGFVRGYQSRWVNTYGAVPGLDATTPQLAKARDAQDTMNREIFEESLKIIKTAWTNPTFTYDGKYWQFPRSKELAGHPAYAEFGAGQGEDGIVHEIGIAPLPFQKPYPKLYGAFAHSMRTIDMWAREGGKPIVMANDMDFCEALWNRYKKTSTEAGHAVPDEDVAAWGGVLVLGDSKRVERISADHDWYWDKFWVPFGQAKAQKIMGDPDQVSKQIEDAHKRLGFNEMWIQFGQGHLDPEENHEELHRFATEVIPRFADKDETGTWV